MKVRYVGKSFGVDGLTDQRVYAVLGVDHLTGALRLVDDSGEDYLYNPQSPKPNGAKEAFGRFEVIEDDDIGTLRRIITN